MKRKRKKQKPRVVIDWDTGIRIHKPKKGKGSYDRKNFKSGNAPDFFLGGILEIAYNHR